jgi:predicted AAA+ superfamily ATPase
MIKRERYLSRIRNSYASELIKVITGVHRCGKSVLLSQIIEELREAGVDDSQIISLNFEDYDNQEYTDPENLHNYIKSLATAKEKYYLFFDEVQYVRDFERVINSFRVKFDCSIFVTGSNGKLLSGDFATVLSGRFIELKMMPLVFSEYLELTKGNREDSRRLFNAFVADGGMPYIYNTESELERKLYIHDLYNSIILRDIVQRYEVKDTHLLDRIAQFFMENIGGLFSANSIAQYLKAERVSTTVDTVLSYADKLSAALLFSKVSRYDIRGKKVMSTLEKYYIADQGFLKLKKSSIEEAVGSRLENIVYNELISRGYTVYVGKTDKGEIDFVTKRYGELEYLQVTDYLSSDRVVAREFGAYDSIRDNYAKTVLSMDEIDYSRNGIKHRNIVDWLLD